MNGPKAKPQTIIYTIVYAIEAGQSLEGDEAPLEHLRQYGMAEVYASKVVDKPLDEVTMADAPALAKKSIRLCKS
jgi:hypothetical protein